jgi:hypothetical protein
MDENNSEKIETARGEYAPARNLPSNAPGPAPNTIAKNGPEYASAKPTPGYSPSVNSIGPAVPATSTHPEGKSPEDGHYAEERENRRTKLSSNLIEQKHKLIGDFGWLFFTVITALYLLFFVIMVGLFLSGTAFHETLPKTTLILVGMCGSVPTVLSISLLVGLFKEKESKDDKSASLDPSSIIKVCTEVIKAYKGH